MKKMNELSGRVRQTTKTVQRLLKLVWEMDRRVFILAFFTAILPFINAYIL